MSVRILCDVECEKVWAAMALFSGHERWVRGEDVLDFILKCQEEAESLGYEDAAPATRYAKVPTLMSKLVWDVGLVIKKIIDLLDYGMIEMKLVNEERYFKTVHPNEHRPYTAPNNSVVCAETWAHPFRYTTEEHDVEDQPEQSTLQEHHYVRCHRPTHGRGRERDRERQGEGGTRHQEA